MGSTSEEPPERSLGQDRYRVDTLQQSSNSRKTRHSMERWHDQYDRPQMAIHRWRRIPYPNGPAHWLNVDSEIKIKIKIKRWFPFPDGLSCFRKRMSSLAFLSISGRCSKSAKTIERGFKMLKQLWVVETLLLWSSCLNWSIFITSLAQTRQWWSFLETSFSNYNSFQRFWRWE